MPVNHDPRLTVVVMTRDRPDDLARSLPRHEAPVVVVDNGSTAPVEQVVREARPDATYLRLGANLGAPARNLGVSVAHSDYVAFADDDSWWAPGALERAVEVLDAHPRLAVLAGRVQVGDDGRTDPLSVAMGSPPRGREPDLPGPSVTGFLACAAVVRRDAFLAAGGFDPVVFFPGEEERLALDLLAAGWGMAYVDSVVACHRPAERDERSSQRAALLARNALLTAWMRRPLRVAVAATCRAALDGPAGRAGLFAALPRLPRALGRRRVVPAHVERLVAGR